MSKFFDIQSSESESSDSEEEQVVEVKKQLNFSSDSEDEKRVVRSEKEKKYDELQKIVKDLKQHKNIKDMTKVLQDFELLVKIYEKTKKTMGIDSKFYVRLLAELDDFTDNSWKNKKDLNKNNAKSLTALRQKLKKYNKDFENEINDFKEHSENYPSELIGEVEEEIKVEHKNKDEFDEDDDEEEWDETSSESSDDSVEYQNISDRFLKSNTSKHDDKKKKEKKEKDSKRKVTKTTEDETWTVVDSNKHKIFATDEEISFENVLRKLNEEIDYRSLRKDNRKNQTDVVEELYKIVVDRNMGLGLQMKIKMVSLTSLLQYKCNSNNPCMVYDNWAKALRIFNDIIVMLESNLEVLSMRLGDIDEPEKLENEPYVVHGCIVSLLQQIDDEFTRALVNHDFNDHTNVDYAGKLRSETELSSICERISAYMEIGNCSADKKCIVYATRMNYLYYRVDPAVVAKEGSVLHREEASYKVMRSLTNYIAKNDSADCLRQRAILYLVYYLALHDHQQEAITLLSMTESKRNIDAAERHLKALYNRVTVQLGITAFKHGLVKEAHDALSELQGSGRIKELLGQSVRNIDRKIELPLNADELYKERLQLLPYHKHINCDVIDGVYLICAMLLKMQYSVGVNRPQYSRNLQFVLKNSERLTLVGPPESLKDHVVAACKAMHVGDWETAVNRVFSEKMTRTFWRTFGDEQDRLRPLIVEKIKLESLKIFILLNGDIHDTLSLSSLSDLYQLPPQEVGSLVNRMIITERLKETLDAPSNCIVMHRQKTSALQGAALKMADKIAQLVDFNCKLRDFKACN